MISSGELGQNINKVKTANKLIGEIEHNELYRSDEDLLDGFGIGGRPQGGLNQSDSDENY